MEQSRFFHVCTDGTSNGIIFTCDADFQTAIKISAILAYKMGIRIICYCHMTNHSHFVISSVSTAEAQNYIDTFKREYSVFANKEHGLEKVFRGVRSFVAEINDRFYLKNCISYVLMNPVAAKICRTAEEYKYSSFSAYFSAINVAGTSVRDVGVREMRRIFKTKVNLADSGFYIDNEQCLVPKSFVDYEFVNHLYGGQTWFFKSLALTNSVDEELKYSPGVCRYSDVEIFSEISEISGKRFGEPKFLLLSKSQKLSLIPAIERRTNATPKRLARMLRLDPNEVSGILGSK